MSAEVLGKQILKNEAELSRWREEILAAASRMGFPEQECYGIASAVFEACANALHHGPKDCHGKISLLIRMSGDRFEAVIEDPGKGFACPPETSMPPATSRRGRGIPLMKHFMDDVRFETNGGCKVILIKYLRKNSV